MPVILVIGSGVIGARVFYDLAQTPRSRVLHLLGRNVDQVVESANLARFSALQRGIRQDVSYSVSDLEDVDRTAEIISRVHPDVIFLAVSRQSWRVITTLPRPYAEALAEANFGPWLPMHLAPVTAAMMAVRAASSDAVVVNAAFPDAVHPALRDAGLSPHVGIGNVANNVPALRTIAAQRLGCDLDEIHLRLVAHHYASFRMRHGHTGSAPVGFTVSRSATDVTAQAPLEALLGPLSGEYRRAGGLAGQAMVSAAALSVIEPIVDRTRAYVHGPGPAGLPGGYPLLIEDGQISLDLPPGMSEADAVSINTQGQVHDGISRIEDGYIYFEESTMDVMRRHLGYYCAKTHWSEAGDWAVELGRRFRGYRAREKI